MGGLKGLRMGVLRNQWTRIPLAKRKHAGFSSDSSLTLQPATLIEMKDMNVGIWFYRAFGVTIRQGYADAPSRSTHSCNRDQKESNKGKIYMMPELRSKVVLDEEKKVRRAETFGSSGEVPNKPLSKTQLSPLTYSCKKWFSEYPPRYHFNSMNSQNLLGLVERSTDIWSACGTLHNNNPLSTESAACRPPVGLKPSPAPSATSVV